MAERRSIVNMSEETFDFTCTPCAKDNLIKEALKYCVDCKQYCCKDCLTSHRRIAMLMGHTFLDNTAVKPQGQKKSLPTFPTKQCDRHVGKIMDMYCKSDDVVCCYACVAEDHKSCKDMMSVADNIDQLYNKTETSKATSELGDTLDTLNKRTINYDTLLQQLQDSKKTAIKAVTDYKAEMEQFLKKLEKASIKEIEKEYKKLESGLLEEKKRYDDFINNLKNLEQLMLQASSNIAQLFVCTKLVEETCTTITDEEMKRQRFHKAEVKFVPSEEIKSSIRKMTKLGETSAISSRRYNTYKATKICDMMMNVRLRRDRSGDYSTHGSCIIDDTVIFTDYHNNKLKRYDISSLSLIDNCTVPDWPCGICRVGETELAVACCSGVVQFVSVRDKLSLTRKIKMKHGCFGIACSDNKLYITDDYKSLYMYDMNGILLKTVTRDNSGQSLFEYNKHITLNDKNDRLFVADLYKGLVCFNTQCDYIETITDPDIKPCGVCIDGYDNVVVANGLLSSIVQCDSDGQKCDIIVNKTSGDPRCVCIHHKLRIMFVGFYRSDTVEIFKLT